MESYGTAGERIALVAIFTAIAVAKETHPVFYVGIVMRHKEYTYIFYTCFKSLQLLVSAPRCSDPQQLFCLFRDPVSDRPTT